MSLAKCISRAMERVAPVRLAEKWDNVGLLIEAPFERSNANRILLTIDLTPPVVQEALSTQTAFIVSYHPTIFKPLSALTLSNPLQASLLRCAAAGISVYSPHTALDSVYDGINDWLAKGLLGKDESADIEVLEEKDGGGLGRIVKMHQAVEITVLIDRVKKYLQLLQLQVAYPHARSSSSVSSIAICAGSGGSILLGVDADVYFTGEMAHHEVLAAIASGKHVILCGHTNTERGYLPTLASKLKLALASETGQYSQFEVHVSKEDRHPLDFI